MKPKIFFAFLLIAFLAMSMSTFAACGDDDDDDNDDDDNSKDDTENENITDDAFRDVCEAVIRHAMQDCDITFSGALSLEEEIEGCQWYCSVNSGLCDCYDGCLDATGCKIFETCFSNCQQDFLHDD